jgi:hypothetical protein
MNRADGLPNHIANLPGVMEFCTRRYAQSSWEWITSMSSIEVNARSGNELNFFCAPHGAGSANTLYMQSKAAYCELQSGSHANFIHVAQILGMFYVTYRVPGMSHFDRTCKNVLPLDKAADLLARMVFFLQHVCEVTELSSRPNRGSHGRNSQW